MAILEIIKPGLYTTIQDQGRLGFAHLGVPVSGAMDRKSFDLANIILDNPTNASMLECTLVAPTIRFDSDTYIAMTGAIVQSFIDNKPTLATTLLKIKKGETLSFGKFINGSRLYLSILGGIQSDLILNSRSACPTSEIMTPLKRGDKIFYSANHEYQNTNIELVRKLSNDTIRVYKGPEFDILSPKQIRKIEESHFRIEPSSNRMAIRVNHALNLKHDNNIISSATIPGTVQLTPSGELIFLMRDAQTTGGYPRVLQLSESSISDISQIRPGKKFNIVISDL